jgi:hypothetical protein
VNQKTAKLLRRAAAVLTPDPRLRGLALDFLKQTWHNAPSKKRHALRVFLRHKINETIARR